jgi:dipeptidase E
MKLFLSSYRFGDNPKDLLKVFGKNKRVAIIANAVDHNDPQERALKVEAEHDALRDLGYRAEELDLRNYFSNKKSIAADLKNFDCLWVRGGNAFLLRRAFAQSGLDLILPEFMNAEKIAYGGYSAGVCILGPSLDGLELVDDPTELAENYSAEVIWEGLTILDYVIVPHYKSDHPESEAVDNTVQYFEDNAVPYKTLKDGETILVY